MKYDFRFAFYAMTIVAIGMLVSLLVTANKANQAKQEAAKLSFDLLSAQSQARGLHAVVKHYEQSIAEQDSEYVDEANITGDFPNTEELGKAYPRIIIDGVKCDYDPEQKWFVHAALRCRVMWMGFGKDMCLMDQCDWRNHEGPPYENQDGDIRVLMQPIQILEKGKWRSLRTADTIHVNAAIGLGLQSKGETPERDTVSRIGLTNLWAGFDGSVWHLVDTNQLPDDVKAGLNAGPQSAEGNGESVSFDEHSPAALQKLMTQTAVESQQRDAQSSIDAAEALIARLRSELHAAEELKQLLSAEQKASDKEPRLGEYSPDPDGVAAYGRDSQEWEKRNRQDVYAPGLVTPTGDR
jgi:hypothetical protein